VTQTCISCGMPMSSPEDFPQGDVTRSYCRYCARPDGSMQSYDEKLASFTGFLEKTQGLDPSVAAATAREIMSGLPAWRDMQPPGSQTRPAPARGSIKKPL
jgi:hypothetical protein